MPFTLTFAVDAKGNVQGTMNSGDEDRMIENGRWNAAKKTLAFEYESGTYGRLTSTATMNDKGQLSGAVKTSPDSDGYAWEATKKPDA